MNFTLADTELWRHLHREGNDPFQAGLHIEGLLDRDTGRRAGWVQHADGTWSVLGEDGRLGERFQVVDRRVMPGRAE